MTVQFNKFKKKPDSKTAFILSEGQAIFSPTVYLLNPIYVHKRSPDFSLVSGKGKHVSGLFRVSDKAYLGDHDKKALIVFISREGLSFDLFLTDLTPLQAKQMLLNGELNESFAKARSQAA